jgi:hypothetical protein
VADSLRENPIDPERLAFLKKLNWGVGGYFLFAFATLALVCVGMGNARAYLLLLVATASFGVGHIIGFLYGVTTDEKERFSDALTLFNGLLSGALLTDIARDGSWTLKAAHSLSLACGLSGTGALLPVLATFAPLGFVHAYFHKRLLVNLLQKRQDAEIDQIDRSRKQVDEANIESDPGGRKPPTLTSSLKRAAEMVAASPTAGLGRNLEELRADGKALFLTRELDRAEEALLRALELAPEDPDSLYTLAQVLIDQAREGEAVPLLQRLVEIPGAPDGAWKLLGYALLFTDDLEESQKATERYLKKHPEDLGALLNLACVFGQRGPENPGARERLLPLLDRLLKAEPRWMARVRALTRGNEDFSKWKGDPAFRRIVPLA